MDVANVWGWVMLALLSVAFSALCKRPAGRRLVFGMVLAGSLFGVGYVFGYGAAARDARAAVRTYDARSCYDGIGLPGDSATARVRRCVEAEQGLRDAVDGLGLPWWFGLGSWAVVIVCLVGWPRLQEFERVQAGAGGQDGRKREQDGEGNGE